MNNLLLSVRNLRISYKRYGYVYKVLNGVWLDVKEKERVGLIGESGAGKTTLMKSILRILPNNAIIESGEILYKGKNILNEKEEELVKIRRSEIAMIFQDPTSSLNPLFKIKDQFFDILKYSLISQGKNPKNDELNNLIKEHLKEAALPDVERVMESFPFQLSGGMRQRVVIAMALATANKLLLADEPTTNLDVTIQAQILNLINELVKKKNLSVILVSHALGMVRNMTERIYVMYAGDTVESAPTAELFKNPLHPYTQGLLASTLKLTGEKLPAGIPGNPPDYRNPPSGCRFHTRCPFAMEICKKEKPKVIEISSEHYVACWLYSK